MKAISLWQPWASAIAFDAKRIETRHWPTKYRGRLAIHAAARCIKRELEEFQEDSWWLGALKNTGFSANSEQLYKLLPFGAIVAVCDLTDCRKAESFKVEEFPLRGAAPNQWTEPDMGNFSDGRYGWVLENIVRLVAPIPFKGKQGFFNLPPDLIVGEPAIPASAKDLFSSLIASSPAASAGR